MNRLKEFEQLLEHLDLSHAEVKQRLNFLDWSQADVDNLARYSPVMLDAQEPFLDRLYQRLVNFSGPAELISDPVTLTRLKVSQSSYYRRLWLGPHDHDYVCNRLRVGWVHLKIGLELKWYLGAYRLYLQDMHEQLLGQEPAAACFQSLLKAVFFDISLAVDTYSSAQRKALEVSDERFARALRGANDALWDWHMESDQLYLSERWSSMLGLHPEQVGSDSSEWFARVHPDDLGGLRQAINAHLQGETDALHYRYRLRRHNDRYLWVLVRGIVEQTADGERRMAGSQTDISKRYAATEQLHYAVRHDSLTGLANRTQLDEWLIEQRQVPAEARKAALLFIDLDRFKLINDSLGHRVGDRVLVEIAKRLKQCMRSGDRLVRYGGDEFVVLLNGLASMLDAEAFAGRVLISLQAPLLEQGLVVSASIGIADFRDENADLDSLQAADLALQRAKTAGKAQFARYSGELQIQARQALQLQNDLDQALSRSEFCLHYQPIYQLNVNTPVLVGLEALVRWEHCGQLVSPLDFIPSLEESGAILEVGEWVLRQACQQLRDWQQAGYTQLHCAVNLSSRQLHEPGFAAKVALILAQTGLPASSLVLELTESLLLEDSLQVHACLADLAQQGIRLALDDFGTGYSALSYLTRFPLHILKLDKSFISGGNLDKSSRLISRAVIGLGHSLGLSVVAEGVEENEHLEFLRAEGCQFAQGYWFSRPLPAPEILRLLRSEGPCAQLEQPPLAL